MVAGSLPLGEFSELVELEPEGAFPPIPFTKIFQPSTKIVMF